MPENKVTRRATLRPAILRAADDGTPDRHLEGYAAVFGVESAVLWDEDVVDEAGEPIPFVEILDPAVFDRSLRDNPDVRALFNHNTGAVPGRTKSGTLTLKVDESGLAFSVELPDTQAGRDARVSVWRGDIDGCSFGFGVREDRVEPRQGKPAIRTLLDVDLYEISPAVAFPAYGDTQVALRARMARRHEPAPDPRVRHEYERRCLELASS